MTPHVVDAKDAPLIREWMRTRGGIAIWRSANLSNPGASWTTPATAPDGGPAQRPNWQADIAPVRVITNPADVVIVEPVEVSRMRVAIEQHGLMLKLTTASSRALRHRLARLGAGHFYRFDYETQEAVFCREGEAMPLMES
jgi:hypothetical protein